jgi:hypothetical protein
MGSKQLGGALVAGVLVVAVVAAVDAVRSGDAGKRPGTPRTDTRQDDAAGLLAARLGTEGLQGLLYYSDPEDDCRLHALRLPTLDEASAPRLSACRFQLPPDPAYGETSAGKVAWHPTIHLGAVCLEGRVVVSTATGAPLARIKGCAPAWKPDGTLTALRNGEVWCVRTPSNDACERRLLSTRELTAAAHAVRFVPTGPRHIRSVRAIRVAWFGEKRSAVLVRVRLRGRLQSVGPVTVLAAYDGRRLLRATQYAGAFDLRMSPRRSFIGVIDASGQLAIVTRRGEQLLGSGDLPAPETHAVAWSSDERWTAVATPRSVYLLPTSDLLADREPRIIRLPLAAGDLAWR